MMFLADPLDKASISRAEDAIRYSVWGPVDAGISRVVDSDLCAAVYVDVEDISMVADAFEGGAHWTMVMTEREVRGTSVWEAEILCVADDIEPVRLDKFLNEQGL
jgi:hypothetical protein